MNNAEIAENFSLLSRLMDINGENSFKTKTYSIAAFQIENLPVQLKDLSREEIFQQKGVGGSVGNKVMEMLETSHLEVLQEYILKTPAGVIEMLNIKGIGPKKINTIWKEMEIESVGELLYACNENRLTRFKGFGEKTQLNVQEAIEFYFQNQGNFLYAQMEEFFPQIDGYLKKLFPGGKTHVTGAWRRNELTIEQMEFVVLEDNETVKPKFVSAQPPELVEETPHSILYKLKNGLRLKLYTGGSSMTQELFQTSGSPAFVAAFTERFPGIDYSGTEESVFAQAGLPYIEPYLRERAEIIDESLAGKTAPVIGFGDIRGIIHNHSDWSDGVNTIEEMARECINKGFEYLVLSDHSKAAAYARGLTESRIREQHELIDRLNTELAPFRIFKSIECDILNDGSMDYSDDVLATFDLVIASIHSNLKMPQDKAMARLLRAIGNPYVTILGHLTGRLLLSRRGYPVDHEAIIEACAANKVVIELNAHPRRLDIDYSWIPKARKKGVLISIDPDAHALEGFNDVKYGILAAQKGGLTKEGNLSSFSLKEFEAFLAERAAFKKIN
ncbi:MAG: DNA polymerase/3'-5' exonuclease PolX [Chitinophagaceae bacterium]|nr:MAG: DNA polymerase/3'-5' exonuclease PolX [Chitinophagaceae bacterium]